MEQQNCSLGDQVFDQEPPPKKIKSRCEVVKFRLPNDKGKISLPCPFPLPKNYPPEVECALSMKTMLPRQLNRFLTTVARAIFSVKCYPTGKEYENVAKQIVSNYTFLASPAGTPYVRISFIGKQS